MKTITYKHNGKTIKAVLLRSPEVIRAEIKELELELLARSMLDGCVKGLVHKDFSFREMVGLRYKPGMEEIEKPQRKDGWNRKTKESTVSELCAHSFTDKFNKPVLKAHIFQLILECAYNNGMDISHGLIKRVFNRLVRENFLKVSADGMEVTSGYVQHSSP